MTATFDWQQDTGTQTGAPTKGTTRTANRTDTNWKSIDDTTSSFQQFSVQNGLNSFEVWMSGHFSGTYTSIFSGLWAHTAGVFPTGVTLKGIVGTAYTTPSQTANSNLTTDMTSAIAIGSGAAVQFGATGPEAAGKGASTTANPAWSQFLTTQAQVSSTATQGDSALQTLSLQYNEN